MKNDHQKEAVKAISRRDLLRAGVLGGAMMPFLSSKVQAATLAMPDAGTFNISFRNQHTGESFSGAYRVGARYLPQAFERINHVLRDFRTGEIFPIDPRVIDVLFMVRKEAGTSRPFEVLSGYRSAKTNAMLRASTDGVASNSLHMTGQAIDVRLPGYSTKGMANIASGLRVGGVGYYRRSNFVHMDTGSVRRWNS